MLSIGRSRSRLSFRSPRRAHYTLPEWQTILAGPYRHPKHHFTFAHGTVVYDPDNLCPELAAAAARALTAWPPAVADLDQLRLSVAIQRDKIAGYLERDAPLHLRFYAVGFAQLACILLVTHWDGFAVDGGKNLTRVLAHSRCPASIRESVTALLTSHDLSALAEAALTLADQCLALTGGPVDEYHGGLPR